MLFVIASVGTTREEIAPGSIPFKHPPIFSIDNILQFVSAEILPTFLKLTQCTASAMVVGCGYQVVGRGFQVAEAFVQIIDTIKIIDLPVWLHISMAVLGGMCINTKTVSPFNFKTSVTRVEGYSADFSSETLPHAKPSSAAFCSPTLD